MAFVRQRGKSWYAYWDEYSSGKRIPRAKSFGTGKVGKKAADDFVLLTNADRLREVPEPSMVVFRDWWKRYEVEKLLGLTEKVQAMYRSMYHHLLLPRFGSKNLGSIRKTDVKAWMTWAESQAGLGSVEKAFTVLSSIMNYADDLDVLPSGNPCRGMGKYLKKPGPRPKRPHLSYDEVLRLSSVVHHDFKALILAMGVLGMRPSEAVALRVGDVDLDRGTIHIHRAAVDVPKKGMVERGTTKTDVPRTIPLMGTEQSFKDHLRYRYDTEFWVPEMGPRRIPHKDDLLFQSPRKGTEGMINAPALASLVRKAAKRIGKEGVCVSYLRHIADANLIEATKGDIAFAAYVLGNSPAINLKHYDHGTPRRWQSAIESVRKAVTQNPSPGEDGTQAST